MKESNDTTLYDAYVQSAGLLLKHASILVDAKNFIKTTMDFGDGELFYFLFKNMSTLNGTDLILDERIQQIIKFGFTERKDWEAYGNGELKQAAKYCLTLNINDYPEGWSWWLRDKIEAKKQRLSEVEFEIEMTKISGAFCAAHIDVLLNDKKFKDEK